MPQIQPVPVIQKEDAEETLREVSQPIPLEEIDTPEFQDFLKLLKASMLNKKVEKGWMHAGISAIQIGIPKRVFYMYDAELDDYKVFINPEVKPVGSSTSVELESCLSIDGVKGDVVRPKKVKVKYYDEHGEYHKERFRGWDARVIQHEYDHLQGVLFTDKIVHGSNKK